MGSPQCSAMAQEDHGRLVISKEQQFALPRFAFPAYKSSLARPSMNSQNVLSTNREILTAMLLIEELMLQKKGNGLMPVLISGPPRPPRSRWSDGKGKWPTENSVMMPARQQHPKRLVLQDAGHGVTQRPIYGDGFS